MSCEGMSERACTNFQLNVPGTCRWREERMMRRPRISQWRGLEMWQVRAIRTRMHRQGTRYLLEA